MLLFQQTADSKSQTEDGNDEMNQSKSSMESLDGQGKKRNEGRYHQSFVTFAQ